MRYYHLTEDASSSAQVVAMLTNNCAPFIQELGGINGFLTNCIFRGSAGSSQNETVRTIDCPVDRKPKDTVMSFHLLADEWFYDETGTRFRSNALFGTGARDIANRYGADLSEVLVPIGEFNYCWSNRIHDMTKELNRALFFDNDSEETFINRVLNNGHYQFNTGLVAGVDSQNEIMINCATAYLINVNYFSFLREEVFGWYK